VLDSIDDVTQQCQRHDLQFVPGLHSVQFTEPRTALNVPRLHSSQELDARLELNKPGRHNLQDVDPLSLLYEPAQKISNSPSLHDINNFIHQPYIYW